MTTTAAPKLVGPVIRGVDEDIIDAVIAASEQDNPDAEIVVEDRGGYVRIQADRNFRLTQKSMQAALGRPFRLAEIEPSLVSFGGRLDSMDDEWVWTIHTA
ncbi:MmoB/DmpM family protein [Bradyrhizobium sp. SRS-191]|uniref:MmoB/DmpM family protein n=1 Tax=Bradyrhizobium sp. SRS-191 TaxID=2962606 RepID=UPI00211EA573|nr:MmoB/DmpM family protein [Bradyrhizobium sp. SRS-191]